jgi:hypothetical protein
LLVAKTHTKMKTENVSMVRNTSLHVETRLCECECECYWFLPWPRC